MREGPEKAPREQKDKTGKVNAENGDRLMINEEKVPSEVLRYKHR